MSNYINESLPLNLYFNQSQSNHFLRLLLNFFYDHHQSFFISLTIEHFNSFLSSQRYICATFYFCQCLDSFRFGNHCTQFHHRIISFCHAKFSQFHNSKRMKLFACTLHYKFVLSISNIAYSLETFFLILLMALRCCHKWNDFFVFLYVVCCLFVVSILLLLLSKIYLHFFPIY